MADTKISALPASTTPLAGTEVLPIVQSSSTKQVSVANLTAGRAVSATTFTSTVAVGTAPLVVTSTTNVANLNASSLNGATFAAPGAIGSTTASTGKFSTAETTGKFSIGAAATAGVFHYVVGTNNTDVVAYWSNPLSTLMYTGLGNVTYAAGENGADAAFYARKGPSSGRSINAAGTVNASGADYAEYMEKSGDFTIAKGDICGIDANGKLTNVFADALSFVVKSTNPSYVGGDTWGSELTVGEKPTDPAELQVWEAKIEAARQKVDRIAFAGQVPVNVTGATAGQYIVPINNNGAIKGEAVSNPTFEQYQQAVGKVISVTNDTPTIIVKVS